MGRNIKLAALLAVCKNSWFWLGIWIFYYLIFTDYSGIGVIETALILTMILTEIPTGAVADLLGKRRTLILAFILEAAGSWLMTFAPSFNYLWISVIIMVTGGSFYSGTIEALVFDSLKQNGKEKKFDRYLGRINAIALITPAVCGIIGGIMYTINPRLPFAANSVFYTLGIGVSLFLKEPFIDTVKFSFSSYRSQILKGFHELFRNSFVTKQTIILLSIGTVIVICDEMLNGMLAFEYGLSPQVLGVLWAAVYLLSGLASYLTPEIKRFFSYQKAVIILGFIIVATLIITPFTGMVLGIIFITLRSMSQFVYTNAGMVLVNESATSVNRATTISTYNLLKNIPYALTAYLLGTLAGLTSAFFVAMILGTVLIPVLAMQIILYRKNIVIH